jgi:hypothetical protein
MFHAGATTRRGLFGSSVLLGTLVLLSACSSGPVSDSTAESEPQVSETPTPTPTPFRWENERLLAEYGPAPLDEMFETSEESDIYLSAREILVTQCMAEQGFAALPELAVEFPDYPVPSAAWDDGLGLVDLEIAQTFGYQGEMDAQWWAAYHAYNDAVDARSAQYSDPVRDEAEYGAGGCERQALDTLNPVDTSALDRDLIFSLDDLAVQQTQADPSVVESVTRWTGCMAEAGYTLTAIPISEASPEPATPEQIAQAVADVGCKQSVGLIDIYIPVLYASQRALMNQYDDQVALMIEATDARIEAARELVGE